MMQLISTNQHIVNSALARNIRKIFLITGTNDQRVIFGEWVSIKNKVRYSEYSELLVLPAFSE